MLLPYMIVKPGLDDLEKKVGIIWLCMSLVWYYVAWLLDILIDQSAAA